MLGIVLGAGDPNAKDAVPDNKRSQFWKEAQKYERQHTGR